MLMAKLPRLSKQDKELLIWVGLCITEWAAIDHLLFRIAQIALNVGSGRAAIVYQRTSTLDGRITLVDELVTRVIKGTDPEDQKERSDLESNWISIVKDIRALITFRNKLAHWRRTQMSKLLETGEMSKPFPVLSFNPLDLHRGKRSVLNSSEIKSELMSDDFTRVSHVIEQTKRFMLPFTERMPLLPVLSVPRPSATPTPKPQARPKKQTRSARPSRP